MDQGGSKTSSFHLITIACLITGNLVGAGILALPIDTGLAGFVPSLVGMLICGTAMLGSALILSKEASDERNEYFNYPSLYHRYLGGIGKWAAIVTNMIILYGLLTAYLTGSAAIVASLFGHPVSSQWFVILVFIVMTLVALTELELMRKYNVFIMALLWLSFGAIVFMAAKKVDTSRFSYADWRLLPASVPIIVTSFHFHNIIPSVCSNLKWDFRAVWKAVLAGMLIGYAMNAAWIFVSIGDLPLASGSDSILGAFDANLPATVPLSHIISTPMFVTAAMVFALLAIATSYFTNGIGLMDFVTDLTKNHLGIHNRTVVIAATFLPPFAVALIYPNAFIKVLDIVGGVGIVILFGILPSTLCLIKFKSRAARLAGIAMLLLFACFLLFEIGQELGILHIRPDMEYWNHHVK